MMNDLPNVIYWFGAGVLLFGGVFLLRFILKFTWKFIRVFLIITAVVLLAGYFFGFLEISLR
jgi:hypothetical protein